MSFFFLVLFWLSAPGQVHSYHLRNCSSGYDAGLKHVRRVITFLISLLLEVYENRPHTKHHGEPLACFSIKPEPENLSPTKRRLWKINSFSNEGKPLNFVTSQCSKTLASFPAWCHNLVWSFPRYFDAHFSCGHDRSERKFLLAFQRDSWRDFSKKWRTK